MRRPGPAHPRRPPFVREALRALLLAHNGVEADVAGAAAVVADASRRARLELGPALGLVPAADGIDGVLGELLTVAARAAADGSWSRLKACRSETCRWAFYDAARTRSRTWCSMAVCGNRAKARAFRRRREPGAAGTT